MLGHWIEAIRPRTIPVSVAGVVAGSACAVFNGGFDFRPALLCLVFAVLAQVAANFANEYYDYKNGVDKKGREGFRRGVTEGDISPAAMKTATYLTLAAAAVVGCSLLFFGEWWLVVVGILVAVFAISYSAGPYPLSHHGLGDIAVVVFFGIVPVTLTCYLQQGNWDGILYSSLPTSVAVGIMAANVLVVNNYRDMEEDKAVGKNTTVVLFGRKTMSRVYLFSGIVAVLTMTPLWIRLPLWGLSVPGVYLLLHICVWRQLDHGSGAMLNGVLARTARNLLLFTLLLLVVLIIV